jgi:integrase
MPSTVTPIALADFRGRLLSLYESSGKRPRTLQKMSQLWDELCVTLGPDATTADLTTDSMVAWNQLFGEVRAPNTRIGQLSYFRAAITWAMEEGWVERAPSWKRLRPRRRRPAAVRHLSVEEIRRLLRHLRSRADSGSWPEWRLYALVSLLAYCGLRRDEALFLRVEDLDLRAGIIWLAPHHRRELKTDDSEAPVPIPPELAPILEAWLPLVDEVDQADELYVFPGVRGHGAWSGGKPGCRPIDHYRQAVRESLGIAGALFTWLRVSWGTHGALVFGMSDPEIQAVLRHTTPVTGRRFYRERDLADLRAIGSRVRYLS